MNYAYAQKKRDTAPPTAAPRHSGGVVENSIPNSVRLAALQSGVASPTAAEKGSRVDLPEAMRAKMESSFGMDFSAVKLYESRALEGTGAEAMARGNEIAFAPGKLDFASMEGQSLLGHELSHVASQARGEVHGSGFLNDHALEHRADMEGAMAARGESVFSAAPYGGAVAPLSSASAAPMAGPMQASRTEKEEAKAAKQNEKTASRLAKLQDKINSNKASDKDRAKYEEMMNEASGNQDLMEALFTKRDQKRDKEMAYLNKGIKSDYHSQDRYDSVINNLDLRSQNLSAEEKELYDKRRRNAHYTAVQEKGYLGEEETEEVDLDDVDESTRKFWGDNQFQFQRAMKGSKFAQKGGEELFEEYSKDQMHDEDIFSAVEMIEMAEKGDEEEE